MVFIELFCTLVSCIITHSGIIPYDHFKMIDIHDSTSSHYSSRIRTGMHLVNASDYGVLQKKFLMSGKFEASSPKCGLYHLSKSLNTEKTEQLTVK